MKFTKYILFFLFLLTSSCFGKKWDIDDFSQMYPPYKLIKLFSKKMKLEVDLDLFCYGINHDLPKGYEFKNGIANFTAAYYLKKDKNDEFSLGNARNLLVFLTENFLQEINSDPQVSPDLDNYPIKSDFLYITIHIVDEKKIELGQGVARVYSSKGKIKYQGYKIREYRDQYPALGEHYTIHEESYQDALEIVKKQGNLKYLPSTNFRP